MRMRDSAPGAQLHEWVLSESWVRHGKSLKRLTAKQRELLYELGAKELGYQGAEPGAMRLMGTPGAEGDYTVAPGSSGGMVLRPHTEEEYGNASDELQAQAERIAAQRGQDLSDLAQYDPEMCERLYKLAAQTVNYRGAQPEPQADEMLNDDPELESTSYDHDELR